MAPCDSKPVVGVFVGGRARRMNGVAKGLLAAPDTQEPIALRLVRIARALGLECVWVGRRVEYELAAPSQRVLDDRPPGIGPLGGLGALLAHAGQRPALAIACDMPYVTPALVSKLAGYDGAADVVARADTDGSRIGGVRYEPLFARYDSSRVLPKLERAIESGVRSFQALFASLRIETLALDPGEELLLRDWDSPDDVE